MDNILKIGKKNLRNYITMAEKILQQYKSLEILSRGRTLNGKSLDILSIIVRKYEVTYSLKVSSEKTFDNKFITSLQISVKMR